MKNVVGINYDLKAYCKKCQSELEIQAKFSSMSRLATAHLEPQNVWKEGVWIEPCKKCSNPPKSEENIEPVDSSAAPVQHTKATICPKCGGKTTVRPFGDGTFKCFACFHIW